MPVTEADLIGAWTLESWEIGYPAGDRVTRPFGDDAMGLILYTPDGYMSAVLSRRDRGRFSTEVVPKAPAEEKLRAFDGYMHYAGRFRVADGVVHHHVEFALNMNLVGTVQVRAARLEDDTLQLSADEPMADGAIRQHRLCWRRASAARKGGR